ncbi:hypothetical protein [Bradyrhizobium sp. LMG 9283]|uniref:hypothetical protein n=1 Tax=Bradyrhizobium sp. LMG 9283 TaxID=592064 RepID=UPI00388D9338
MMGKSIAPITSVEAAQASTRPKCRSAGEGDADADEGSAGMAVQASAEVLITAALVQIVLIEPNAFPRAREAARGWPRTRRAQHRGFKYRKSATLLIGRRHSN